MRRNLMLLVGAGALGYAATGRRGQRSRKIWLAMQGLPAQGRTPAQIEGRTKSQAMKKRKLRCPTGRKKKKVGAYQKRDGSWVGTYYRCETKKERWARLKRKPSRGRRGSQGGSMSKQDKYSPWRIHRPSRSSDVFEVYVRGDLPTRETPGFSRGPMPAASWALVATVYNKKDAELIAKTIAASRGL